MKELIKKLNELQWTARQPQEDYAEPGDGPLDDYVRKRKTLDTLWDQLTALARANNTVVGRRVAFQCMDGNANYVVTHLLKNDKVVVQWINYDEDYIDDRLGDKGVLDLEYVLNITTWQDQLEGIRTSKTDA